MAVLAQASCWLGILAVAMPTATAPPGQPDRIVLLAVCFRAWADDTAETRRIIVPAVQSSGSAWSPKRCLVSHLYDRKSSFATHLVELRGMLLSSVKTAAFRDMCGLVAVSLIQMDRVQIKRLSYQGAVAIKGGVAWTDPGNFVYALWWLLNGFAAKHVLKKSPHDRQCRAYLWCMGTLRTRWPLQKDTPRECERIGDIVELVFAASYMDEKMYWHIQTVLGPIILKVKQFVHHLDNEARFERMRVPGSFFFWHAISVRLHFKTGHSLVVCNDCTDAQYRLVQPRSGRVCRSLR